MQGSRAIKLLALTLPTLVLLLSPTWSAAQDASAHAGATAEPAMLIRLQDQQLTITQIEQDPAVVATRLAEAAKANGIRIDGIASLQGLPPITFRFQSIPLASVLMILADHAGTLLRRAGTQHYQFGAAGENERLQALQAAALEEASSEETSADRPDQDAERALLDFIRPPPEGPVLLATEPWFEAAKRAERADDLARAEALLREAVAHVQRRDGAQGAEYGRALERLGRILGRRGDAAQDQALTEQGLALAEAELGPVHADLAGMQAALAAFRREADRHDEAEDLYRRAIRGYGEPAADSMEALALSMALDGLATLLQQQERWAESIAPLERSFALNRAVFGDDAAGFQAWLLGVALFNQDRLGAAEPMLQYAISNEAPGRRSSEQLLAAIRMLGPFATPDADAGDLPALVTRSAAAADADDSADASATLAGGLLEQRAVRQLRETPGSADWQTSCAAYAIVSMPVRRERDREAVALIRQRSAQRCEERARAAAGPST